jgi:hypothetical protein
MTGDWLDENGHHVMHERNYWRRFPTAREVSTLAKLCWALAAEPSTHYWLTDVLYTDKALAEYEAKGFGFVAQEGFYCEAPNLHWFPIFTDFDKALAFLKEKTGIEYVSI